MKKRTSWSGVNDIWNRETGHILPRSFYHRFWASKGVVMRFDVHKKLNVHLGCVNSVVFNADGSILASASDDRTVLLWDWDAGTVKTALYPGHRNSIFDVKLVPHTGDRGILTSGADGEVRQTHILEGGMARVVILTKHEGGVRKMVLGPDNPRILYSCGVDGFVHLVDLRTGFSTPFFNCKSFQRSSFNERNPLYDMAVDPMNPYMMAVAGGDEYVRLFDIRKCMSDNSADQSHLCDCFCPRHIIDDGGCIVITGVAFSEQRELIASYADEFIYLFGIHDGLGPDFSDFCRKKPSRGSPSLWLNESGEKAIAYVGHRNSITMKCANFFGPKSEYVVSGSDCGRIFVWRKKNGKLLRVMDGELDIVNCVQSHPHAPVLATCGVEDNIKIWIPNAREPEPSLNRLTSSDSDFDFNLADQFLHINDNDDVSCNCDDDGGCHDSDDRVSYDYDDDEEEEDDEDDGENNRDDNNDT